MKIILGDNPFFNVNHRTGGKKTSTDTSPFETATEVMSEAVKNSIDTLMLSDYETAPKLLSKFSAENPRSRIQIALVIPYPHTINNLISSHGYFGALKSLMSNNLFGILLGLLMTPFTGTAGLYAKIFESYIKLQLKKYDILNVDTRYVCLHNVVVDLLLANQRSDILISFIKAVRRIDREPVLITQNISRLVSMLGDKSYTVCGSYNLNGFMTNPSRHEVLQAIENNREYTKYWAMQILASGAIQPQRALKDKGLLQFDAILYATSNPSRVKEFSTLVRENV